MQWLLSAPRAPISLFRSSYSFPYSFLPSLHSTTRLALFQPCVSHSLLFLPSHLSSTIFYISASSFSTFPFRPGGISISWEIFMGDWGASCICGDIIKIFFLGMGCVGGVGVKKLGKKIF